VSAPKQLPREVHESLNAQETQLLEQALAKLVLYGRKIGVAPDEMIAICSTQA
jgi:hypothetical protein